MGEQHLLNELFEKEKRLTGSTLPSSRFSDTSWILAVNFSTVSGSCTQYHLQETAKPLAAAMIPGKADSARNISWTGYAVASTIFV
jgi:hypothetical protein